MNNRLDQVEDQDAATRGSGTKDNQKLSTVKKAKKDNVSRENFLFSSESLDEDSDVPSLSVIISSKTIQQRVDRSLADLDTDHKCQDYEIQD